MILLHVPLLAQEITRTRFQWGRVHSNADLILPIGVCLALLLLVWAIYRRDARELSRPWGWLLTLLRSAVFGALLVLYLQPQWRVEREQIQNPRVVLLADTSLSMGLVDGQESSFSRSQQVARALSRTDFLQKLRARYDVVVARFDEAVQTLALLQKLGTAAGTEAGAADPPERSGQAGPEPGPPGHSPSADSLRASIDWEAALRPSGRQTRLGEALQQVIAQQRRYPLAGIVIFSDGRSNAGPAPESVLEAAAEANVPLFSVAVGSREGLANVRVYELEVPERAYPGDPYTVTGLVQAQGLPAQSIPVQLVVRDPQKGSEETYSEKAEIRGEDGEVVPVKFQLTPTETGRRQIVFQVVPPRGDPNPADNQRVAEIEIAEPKARVLLLAGGASREYQFLRGLLYRDRRSVILDVLLQTGSQGVSQDAARVLDEFPATAKALFEYDCIVALDPRWQALSPSQIDLLERWVAEQAGGLIVIAGPVYTGQAVGGWVQDPAMAKIRALYPVEFPRHSTLLDSGTYSSREPWPLRFTREYQEAPFLWLADTFQEDQAVWGRLFPGVEQGPGRGSFQGRGMYSCYPVRSAKPAAKVYAYFSDPGAADREKLPIYMAGQFYGSGQVFYLGSGEMWRLRALDEAYFDRFYTRLIRHVAQGRLLRQSKRGMLLVEDRPYTLGSTVEVQAHLTDARAQPLQAARVPMQVIHRDVGVQTVMLLPDPRRPGVFLGQITVSKQGDYRLQVSIPDSTEEPLSRRIRVSLPDQERQNPQRDDATLRLLAEGFKDAQGNKLCEGKYYPDLEAAVGPGATDPLVGHLKGETRTVPVDRDVDRLWERLAERVWFRWMMLVVCGLLSAEWLIRRLWKLA